jgi:hypothetical protein
MSGLMKWYLLVELAFLIQSIFIIHVEERRKDHYQMFAHHIITSTLLTSAYIYGFYNVSNVVLCLMDIVDFLLPVRYNHWPSTPSCGTFTDNSPTVRQNPQVPPLPERLQCRIRHFHVHLVHHTARPL